MPLSDVDAFRTKYGNKGVYITAYRYQSTDQSGLLDGDMYLDFDIANLDTEKFEMIRLDAVRCHAMFVAVFGIEKEQIQLYFSGKKGFHFIIPGRVMAIEPRDDLNMVFKFIAQDMNKVLKYKTIDTKIYDRVRLFRLPNSLHPDTNLYKIPITLEELRGATLAEIEALAGSTREPMTIDPRYNTKASKIYRTYIDKYETEAKLKQRSDKKGEGKLDFMPTCVKNILHQPAPEGGRNNTCAVLASYFKSRGNSEKEAYDKLLRWSEKRCTPEMKKGEIERTLQSIFHGNYGYGCSALSELGGCDQTCRMYKKR